MIVLTKSLLFIAAVLIFSSCSDDDNDIPGSRNAPVFLLIDEESIDDGDAPNNFTASDVNDQIAAVGLRQQLSYFANNIGDTITLYTGEVGDEGWFALKSIPSGWVDAGPTANGTDNFLQNVNAIGADPDPDSLLYNVLNVTPLRATGIAMLKGKTIIALVYDDDVEVSYGPISANLSGENLGKVAFTIIDVRPRAGGSPSDLPEVRVKIENANDMIQRNIFFFSNAPSPTSSSSPNDVTIPSNVTQPVFLLAP